MGNLEKTEEESNSNMRKWVLSARAYQEERKDLKKVKERGKKDSDGKLNWALLPMEALLPVAEVFVFGHRKHGGKRTWMPGIPFSELFAAIMRHLLDWFIFKKDSDDESGLHPLAHVISNCMMLLTYIENKKFDDR